MLKTKLKSRKQINDLKTDLEIINPIESKKILGGDWYNDPTWDLGWLDEVYVGGGNSGGGGWYDPYGGGTYGDGSYYGDQGGGYGGGGGSSSGSYGLPNLPSTVEQQLGSMGACVSYAMAFMSTYLGHGITGANMAVLNGQTLHLPIQTTLITGLTPAEATQVIQSYFYTTTLTTTAQIINAVETNLHGVLTNVFVTDSQGNNIPTLGHEVVIVDYDPATGLFLAADSSTGTYTNYTSSQINLGNGVYEVTGVKP